MCVGPLVAIYLIIEDKESKIYQQLTNLGGVMFSIGHNVVKIIVQESINPG